MKSSSTSKIKLASFVVLSLLAHIAFGRMVSGYGVFDFTRPISIGDVIPIELNTVKAVQKADAAAKPVVHGNERNIPDPEPVCTPLDPTRHGDLPQIDSQLPAASVVANIKTYHTENPVAAAPQEPEQQTAVNPERIPAKPHILPPHRKVSEFFSAQREKLTYQITLFGVPVGSAMLEATNKNGELRIVSKARSNDALSTIYPVDNMTETRMIGGNYILTTIRRNEGSHKSDTGFTLMLPEKKVFRADRIRKRFKEYPVEDAEVLDIITAIYFIRKQPLEVGRSVMLKLFDSNEYASTLVEVLRRETIVLEGGRQVATLVIHPLLKTDGFFRRSGEVMVWLTDDEFKVPVRLETTIPLGPISVDLVSAEVEPGRE